MNIADFDITELMKFIEENLVIDDHFYCMTHHNEDGNVHHEIYFKDDEWLCRKHEGFQPRMDNWDKFTKDNALEYLTKNNLCVDHFKIGVVQYISSLAAYFILMTGKIENILGADVVDSLKFELKNIEDAVSSAAKPKLGVIPGGKEEDPSEDDEETFH